MEAGSRPLEDGFNGMNREGNKRQILESTDKIDRLSLLPDAILVDILSVIPIESAAATSILSRRWQYLWTQVTHLVFDLYHLQSSIGCYNWTEPFFRIVDHILLQLTASKIHSFCLKFPYGSTFTNDMQESYGDSFESWMSTICGRHPQRIEALDIAFETHTDMITWALPPDFAPPLCLTRLKRIKIKDLRVDEDDDIKMMAYILSNSVALEVLSVYVSVTTTMDGMWDEYKLCETLFHLDRSSLTCEIQFFGQHITSSSKGFNNTIPHCQIFRLGNLVIS